MKVYVTLHRLEGEHESSLHVTQDRALSDSVYAELKAADNDGVGNIAWLEWFGTDLAVGAA